MSEKRNCTLRNCFSNETLELSCDCSKTLYANLEIWIHKDENSMKAFIPENLLSDIKKSVPDAFKGHDIICSCKIGKTTYQLDPLKTINECLRLENSPIAINLGIDDYNPKNLNLPAGDGVTPAPKIIEETDSEPDSTGSSETKKANDAGSNTAQGKSNGKKKKKKKSILPLLLVLVLAGGGGYGYYTYATNPITILKTSIQKENYAKAVDTYNGKIDKDANYQAKAVAILSDTIGSFFDLYLNGGAADELLADLNEFSAVNNTELKKLVSEQEEKIGAEVEAREYFNTAETLFAEGNYLDAAANYREIPADCSVGAKAVEKLDSCISTLISQIPVPSVIEDYPETIDLIKSYLNVVDDSRLKDELAKYQSEYDTLLADSARSELFTNVAAEWTEGNYDDAFSLLSIALKDTPTDTILSDKIESYETEYETIIADQVTALLADSLYSDAISLLDSVIKLHNRETYTTLRTEVEDIDVAAQIAAGEAEWGEKKYGTCINRLKAALEAYPSNQTLTGKLSAYNTEYEKLVLKKVETLVSEQKYADAISYLTKAQAIYDSTSFETRLTELTVEAANAEIVYTAESTKVTTYDGKLQTRDETDSYTLDVTVPGYYGCKIYEVISGKSFRVAIYDSQKEKKADQYLNNNETLSCYLTKGTYTIYVQAYSNYGAEGSYHLDVYSSKASVDLGNYTLVKDSIDFNKQENRYTLTAPLTGYYRFSFNEMMNECTVYTIVKNHLNERVENSEYYLSNGEGITIWLTAGEDYTLFVCQSNYCPSYEMSIGRQTATQTLNIGETKDLSMSFVGEGIYLNFTPKTTTEVTLTFSNMISGMEIRAIVKDHLNNSVKDLYCANGDSFTFTANEGEEYQFRLYQHSELGDFTISFRN